MTEEKKQIDAVSQLRRNPISGEWVIVSTGRGRRPDEFAADGEEAKTVSTEDVFADPEKSGQAPDTLIYRSADGEWTTRVFPNKYPLLSAGELVYLEDGPLEGLSGKGWHEIVVTRDADKHLAKMEISAVAEVIDAYQDRYLNYMTDRDIRYISIFHNHLAAAGASVRHPHSQILALPVVPLAIESELRHCEDFYHRTERDPFEVLLDYELRKRVRLVAENDEFAVLCPFAPKMAFEMWILPRRRQPYFERITDADKMALAEMLVAALRALDAGLGNPPYNFFIRTAPCDGRDWRHYRWYVDIVPRTGKIAGFELATDMEVATVSPEEAADFLRSRIV